MPVIVKRTWRHLASEFDENSPIEKKIELFHDFVWGSQLHVADLLVNGGRDHDDARDVKAIPHSGYAALFILLSYFEMIARYESGERQKGSRDAFIDGVQSVFPEVAQWPYAKANMFLNKMYAGVRCGLYHMARTRTGIAIWGNGDALTCYEANELIVINPHKLVVAIKSHFAGYIERLKDPNQTDLRKAFETRFDREEEE